MKSDAEEYNDGLSGRCHRIDNCPYLTARGKIAVDIEDINDLLAICKQDFDSCPASGRGN